MNRTLLQQALDALDAITDDVDGTGLNTMPSFDKAIDAIAALREALAQPEPIDGFGGNLDEAFEPAPPAAPAPADLTPFERDLLESVGQMKRGEGVQVYPPAPAVPPPIDNRFVAPGCEQFGTRADAESLLTMLRATLDEYMRLAAAPAVPRPDEFTCPYCFDQGAAPAVPLTDEQQIAIREAHCNTASDEYFGARPQVDDATKRRTYEAGFKEGWESGIGGGGNG
jgi:hypothetical protein